MFNLNMYIEEKKYPPSPPPYNDLITIIAFHFLFAIFFKAVWHIAPRQTVISQEANLMCLVMQIRI